MTSIFISYSSRDARHAESIHKFLHDEGFDVWRDKRSIEADWSNEIANALTKQDIILLLWTENASQSDYVKSEWMTARALGKVIKPILFSKDFPSLQLPKPLENVQAIADLGRVDDVEKNIQKLISPLESLNKEATRFNLQRCALLLAHLLVGFTIYASCYHLELHKMLMRSSLEILHPSCQGH